MNARPTTLTVDTEHLGDIQVVRPAGAMDYECIGPLRGELNRYLAIDKPHIVLDLYSVPVCDSCGLGLLLSAQRRAHAAEGWLRVARQHLQMRRMLAATQLDQHIDAFRSVEDAIAGQPSTVDGGA